MGTSPSLTGFTCRWCLPFHSRKNFPWIQHAPRSVCPGQSNKPKEIPWFLLHRLLGSRSSGTQAVNRCHRKGKLGLPCGWLKGSKVQDQQPVTWPLSKKRMEEKALEERRETVRFRIRFACTSDPLQSLLQHSVYYQGTIIYTREIPDNPHGWLIPLGQLCSLQSFL